MNLDMLHRGEFIVPDSIAKSFEVLGELSRASGIALPTIEVPMLSKPPLVVFEAGEPLLLSEEAEPAKSSNPCGEVNITLNITKSSFATKPTPSRKQENKTLLEMRENAVWRTE